MSDETTRPAGVRAGRAEEERRRRIEHGELERAAEHPWPYGGSVPQHAMRDLKGYLDAERGRVLGGATPQMRDRMRAAERRGEVFAAWNAVMATSPEVAREKDHVTGLYYAEADNALVVYVDAQAWGTNLTMMREILRTRMEFQGARVSKIVVRVSREGYRRR